ncbi:MAG: hypothetical protein A4E58_02111 [Syntrophorhabdus sp. PtaB.Bin006]|nr:MAG: hypothetical protein A4E58_02111 [Syntrophorhabdus sp. PtaB.Bin006]OPY77794.1 MAG: hypothetical protein A4E65_02588 [Syntrophorhabdus sp. PtaU1.Bin153]
MKVKMFSTMDLYIAAYLSLHGIEPALENRNGKVIFAFTTNDTLYRLMNDFNSNKDVPVADFATAVKTLRGKMLSLKESITGNGYSHVSFNR